MSDRAFADMSEDEAIEHAIMLSKRDRDKLAAQAAKEAKEAKMRAKAKVSSDPMEQFKDSIMECAMSDLVKKERDKQKMREFDRVSPKLAKLYRRRKQLREHFNLDPTAFLLSCGTYRSHFPDKQPSVEEQSDSSQPVLETESQ